jgi:hypothetical protein
VPIEKLVEGVEKFHEVTGLRTNPIRGGDVRQLVGQITQMHVVVQQLMHAAVRTILPDEGEEQALRGDGLVEDLVAQVVHEPGDLVIRPPPLAERCADRSSSGADLLKQDGVLVREWMLADPVLVPR